MVFEKEKILKFIVAFIFVSIGIISRFLPHPPNFTPVAAIALFGGFYFSKKTALIIPLIIMFFSDLFLGGGYNLLVMASVYGSFLIAVLLGFWLKKNKHWYMIGASAFLSAFLFFAVTNFAVWLFTPWYAKTFLGLIQCYYLAIPFFKNTLLGNIFYTSLFFISYELAMVFVKRRLKIFKTKMISC